LGAWLDLEKSRTEFTVATSELERVVRFANIEVRLRADRVDELPSGRQIILDYKTGQLKAGTWDGERPDEPQLPLYCVTNERPLAGAAFAMVRADGLRFRGSTSPGITLPGMAKKASVPFEDQLLEWRVVLERLAVNYRTGHAEVDPKPGACDNCGLRALCRIREMESGAQL
jgi:hypothetical protein